MFELIKNEFKRYQKWAWLWAIVVLSVFIFSMKFRPFLTPSMEMSAFNHLILMGGCFLFGAVQMILHRRKNHWTFLIHRPISTFNIFKAMFFAGTVIVFMLIVLPWLLMVVSLDLFGKGIVDIRHYTYILYLFLGGLFTYQLGLLTILNKSKAAFGFIVLLIIILAPNANNHLAQFLPAILSNAILFYLNSQSFKPDLSTYLRRPLPQVMLAIPISFAMATLMILSTTVFYHIPKYMMGTHPDNNPKNGSLNYIYKIKTKEYADYALENATLFNEELASSIQQQWPLADQSFFPVGARNFPYKQQLHVYDKSYAVSDEDGISSWQFSHKHMALVGHNLTSGEFSGVIGANEYFESEEAFFAAGKTAQFSEIPFMVFNQFLVFEDKIVVVNFEDNRLQTRFELNEGEKFLNRPWYDSSDNLVSMVTNQRMIIFDYQSFSYEFTGLSPRFEVELLIDMSEIVGVRGSELADGYAFLFIDRGNYGAKNEKTHLIHVDYEGESTLVATRNYTVNRHPDWIEQYDYLISPALFIARGKILEGLDKSAQITSDTEGVTVTAQAIVLHVISLLLLAVLGRKQNLNKSQWLTWTILVSVLSLPAVASFIFMHPFKNVYWQGKPQLDSVASRQVA